MAVALAEVLEMVTATATDLELDMGVVLVMDSTMDPQTNSLVVEPVMVMVKVLVMVKQPGLVAQ